MGVSGLSCSHIEPSAADPDPRRFRITRAEAVGGNVVVSARFEGVTNHEGAKTMLFLGTTEEAVRSAAELDPHFRGPGSAGGYEGPVPFARFEPTALGWRAAVDLAGRLLPSGWLSTDDEM
jgi:hypothetical protein